MNLPPDSRSRVPAWVAAVIAGGLALVLIRGTQVAPRVAGDPFTAWIAAAAAERVFDARVTGGLRHAPRLSSARSWQVAAAASELTSSDPRDRRALAATHLWLGDPATAIERLTREIEQRPDDPRSWSDLAAAHLLRDETEQRPSERVRALEAALRALELDDGLSEARFNRALALDRLGMLRESRDAWDEIAVAERGDGWAVEAAERARRLDDEIRRRSSRDPDAAERAALAGDELELRALLDRDPYVGAILFDHRLLAWWAEACLQQRDDDRQRAARAMDLVARVAAERGDRFWLEVYQAIARVEGGPDPGAVRDLAAAHVAFRRARESFENGRYGPAAVAYEQAHAGFERTGSPYALAAELQFAIRDFWRGRPERVRAALATLEPATRGHDEWPSLRGYVVWMLGTLADQFHDPFRAAAWFREARALFEGAGYLDVAAEVDSRLADTATALGDVEEASKRRAAACRGMTGVAVQSSHEVRLNAANDADALGCPRAGLEFLRADVAAVTEADHPMLVVEALSATAKLLARLGRIDEARRALAEAERWLARMAGDPEQGLASARLCAATGRALRDADPAAARASLDVAVEYFAGAEFVQDLLAALLDRGRALERAGERERALAEYDGAITIWERDRVRVREASARIGFFDRARDLFDAAVRLRLTEPSDTDGAFRMAERARALELRAGDAEVPSPGELAASAPVGETLLYFAALPESAWVWVITRGRAAVRRLPAAAGEIERLARDLAAAMQVSDEARVAPLLAAISDLLIRPIEDLLPASTSLAVVKDGPVHLVPFAALRTSGDGRYLIERFRIAVAPSAVAWRAAAGKVRRPWPAAPRAVVVGNPRFDPAQFPGLAALPFAEREAVAVAAEYPGAVVLLGADATPARFLAEVRGAHIVHYAGHAVANDRDPLSSALVLAPAGDGAGSGGALYARDLYEVELPDTRVVVLGACRTASGRLSRTEGPLSLARPFLAAGVPAVVASRWDVDDRAAAAVLSRFHEHVALGQDPVSALQSAQTGFLSDPNSGSTARFAWAAFEVAIAGSQGRENSR